MNFELQPITMDLLRELSPEERHNVRQKYHEWLKKQRTEERKEQYKWQIKKDNWLYKKKKVLHKANFGRGTFNLGYNLVLIDGGIYDSIYGIMTFDEIFGGE